MAPPPRPPSHSSGPIPSPAPGEAARRWPARLPVLMVLLAVPTLVIGILGAVGAMTDLTTALSDRQTAVMRARDLPLSIETTSLQGAFARLARPDIERLNLLIGDERFEHRGVIIPMSVLVLLLCWLLITGAIGALRRQPFGVPMWSWASLVNIPFAALGMIVTLVRSREILATIGYPVAQAVAAATKRPVETELADLWISQRQAMHGIEALCALWCLWLGGIALYLHHHMPPRPARSPSARPARDPDDDQSSLL